MTKFKILGAVCVAATLAVVSPALARPGHVGGVRSGAHFASSGGTHFAGSGMRGGGFRRGGGGFGPGIAAGVIAGAALGGAYYAADPGYYGDTYAYDPGYSGDSYAYDSGYNNNGGYTTGYNANPNGFVCQPGTMFKGEDGRRHLCQ